MIVSASMFSFVDRAAAAGARHAGDMEKALSLGTLPDPHADRIGFERVLGNGDGGLFLCRGTVRGPDGERRVAQAWLFGNDAGEDASRPSEGIVDPRTGAVIVFASPEVILDWYDRGRDYVGESLIHELVHLFDTVERDDVSQVGMERRDAFSSYRRLFSRDPELAARYIARANALYHLLPSEVKAATGEVLWAARTRLLAAAKLGPRRLAEERVRVVDETENLGGYRVQWLWDEPAAEKARASVRKELESFVAAFA